MTWKAALVRALEQLYALGALDGKGRLSEHGQRMSCLPLEPMYSKVYVPTRPLPDPCYAAYSRVERES